MQLTFGARMFLHHAAPRSPLVINTISTWLHGDERGFRSRGHRIHSSGDYKHRPPKGEHAELHRYMKRRSRKELHIPRECRPIIGRAIIRRLNKFGYRLLALSVGKIHAHGLAELPHDLGVVKLIIGKVKKVSSRAVKQQLPGSIWAAGGTWKPVLTARHERASYDYILYKQGPDAWTWSFKDGTFEGMFGRKRPTQHQNPGRRSKTRSAPAWRDRTASTNQRPRQNLTVSARATPRATQPRPSPLPAPARP